MFPIINMQENAPYKFCMYVNDLTSYEVHIHSFNNVILPSNGKLNADFT